MASLKGMVTEMARSPKSKKIEKRFFKREKTSINISSEEGMKEAKKLLQENSVEGYLSGIERKMKEVLEEFGLPTDDPMRLFIKKADEETMKYLRSQGVTKSNNLGDPNWPEKIQEAIKILVKIKWVREFVAENRANDAVYECLSLMSHVQSWNFRVFEHLLILGSANKKAVSLGGKTTSISKKKDAAVFAEKLSRDAIALLKEGVNPRGIVGILSNKTGKSKTHIRNILKNNNVL